MCFVPQNVPLKNRMVDNAKLAVNLNKNHSTMAEQLDIAAIFLLNYQRVTD